MKNLIRKKHYCLNQDDWDWDRIELAARGESMIGLVASDSRDLI
jgi:hypothetical protein